MVAIYNSTNGLLTYPNGTTTTAIKEHGKLRAESSRKVKAVISWLVTWLNALLSPNMPAKAV